LKLVYSPSDPCEAHALAYRLKQEDIKAEIYGEDLLGAVGRLPFAGLLRVFVADRDYEKARNIIKLWEKEQFSEPAHIYNKVNRHPVLTAVGYSLVTFLILLGVFW